jgi:hypothetical protein
MDARFSIAALPWHVLRLWRWLGPLTCQQSFCQKRPRLVIPSHTQGVLRGCTYAQLGSDLEFLRQAHSAAVGAVVPLATPHPAKGRFRGDNEIIGAQLRGEIAIISTRKV